MFRLASLVCYFFAVVSALFAIFCFFWFLFALANDHFVAIPALCWLLGFAISCVFLGATGSFFVWLEDVAKDIGAIREIMENNWRNNKK